MATDPNLLNTYMAAARAARAAGDYAGAKAYAMDALTVLAELPAVSDVGSSRTEWNSRAIEAFIKTCERSAGSALGIQRTKITRVTTTTDDDY
jgi:hypothetical protein